MPNKTCPQCDRRFDVQTHFCPIDGTPLTLGAGTALDGRYEIVRELGHGAMGVVYLAKERDLGGRYCAIKVLRVRPGTSDAAMSEALKRLRSEAQVLGQLGSHPNLVTVYTAGQDSNGLLYVAMEYVEGETLQAKFDEGTPFSRPQAVRVVSQIARGLSHAHARNIVHRDLKPGNLIFTRDPSSDAWVKIVDFGIAKALDAGSDVSLTGVDRIVGSVGYMSPEQSAARPVDQRSDVFALAVIALELLADDREAASDIRVGGEGIEELADSHAWPRGLKEVLARGLALEPSERYGSAPEFAEAFASAIEGRAVTSGAPVTRPTRPLQSDPVRSGLAPRVVFGGSAIALIALAVAVSQWSTSEALVEPQAATDSTVASTAEAPASESPVPGAGSETVVPASGGTESPGAARPAAPRGVAVPDPALEMEALRAQVDLESVDTSGLREAVRTATRLLESSALADTLGIEVRYLRAEARLLLGDDNEACGDLRTIYARSDRDLWVASRYSRAVNALLELHCGSR